MDQSGEGHQSVVESVPSASSASEDAALAQEESDIVSGTNGGASASNGHGATEVARCTHHLSDEQRELIDRLRRSMKEEFGAQDVDRYLEDEDMIRRYLKGHSWHYETARSYLGKSIVWRAADPRPSSWDCTYCLNNPGYHCMRQIGFDLIGRPVFYSSFIQASVSRNTGDDSVQHFVYLIENGIRTIRHREQHGKSPMSPRVESWVWVMDCTGMGWAACNPKIAMQVNALLADHYPERLGITVAINAGFLMRSAWAAIKVFLSPVTANKLAYLVDLSEKEDMFDLEMYEWILEEERLNKIHPLPDSQRQFWRKPTNPSAHDPRGTRSYVHEFIDGANLEPTNTVTSDKYVPSSDRPPMPHPNTVVDKRRASTAV